MGADFQICSYKRQGRSGRYAGENGGEFVWLVVTNSDRGGGHCRLTCRSVNASLPVVIELENTSARPAGRYGLNAQCSGSSSSGR